MNRDSKQQSTGIKVESFASQMTHNTTVYIMQHARTVSKYYDTDIHLIQYD